VEQFMTTAVQYLTPQTTYGELQTILSNEANLKALPVVENSETLILLGSSSRKHLLESLERRVGDRARQAEALERMNTSLGVLEQRFRSTSEARSQTILAVDQLQPTPNNLEVQKTVPSKMKFYYTDLPEDQPDPKPSMDDMRKMSR
jgi:CBS-domain-containing membrane protein